MGEKNKNLIDIFNFILSLFTTGFAIWGFCIVFNGYKAERKEFNEAFTTANKEYNLANNQFQYQRRNDSIEDLEEEAKFQENIKFLREQVNALRAITEYNLATQRPYFQAHFKLRFTYVDGDKKQLMLRTELKNAGVRPSSDLWVYLKILSMGGVFLDSLEFNYQNGLSPNYQYQDEGVIGLNGNDFKEVSPFYLFVLICYNDPILGKRINQEFFYKWTNYDNEDLEPSLHTANWSDVKKIEDDLRNQNRIPECQQ